MSQWIDISRPIDETLAVWPSHQRPQHTWERRISTGHHCNVSAWRMSAHTGTHMDAPLHFVDGGQAIDEIPPETFIGACEVIDLTRDPQALSDANVAQHLAGVRRLIVRSAHSESRSQPSYGSHDALLPVSAALALISSGLVLIGTDRLSVDDSRGESFSLHHCLLGAGCVIVEGLLLTDVSAGSYELVAAPLRFAGTEASPVRALLRPTISQRRFM